MNPNDYYKLKTNEAKINFMDRYCVEHYISDPYYQSKSMIPFKNLPNGINFYLTYKRENSYLTGRFLDLTKTYVKVDDWHYREEYSDSKQIYRIDYNTFHFIMPVSKYRSTNLRLACFKNHICIYDDLRSLKYLTAPGYYFYELRHGDDGDWCTPVSIESRVMVNYCATIITKEPFDISDGPIYLEEKDFDFGESIGTLKFFSPIDAARARYYNMLKE